MRSPWSVLEEIYPNGKRLEPSIYRARPSLPPVRRRPKVDRPAGSDIASRAREPPVRFNLDNSLYYLLSTENTSCFGKLEEGFYSWMLVCFGMRVEEISLEASLQLTSVHLQHDDKGFLIRW
jgi:hypothetical protein